MAEETKLQFKPLNEGLGFHPFSDGLPYAPYSRSRRQPRPGPPVFVAPQPLRAPVATSQPRSQPRMPLARPEQPAQPAHLIKHLDENPGWGYVIARLFAYAFDLAISTVGGIALLGWALRAGFEGVALSNPAHVALLASGLFAWNWAFIAIQETLFKTTIGKGMMGLSLDGSRPRILLRALLFLVSLSFAGVGVFWAAFNRKRSCWHDLALELQPRGATRL